MGGGPGLDTRSVLFTDLVGSTELRSPRREDFTGVKRRARDDLTGAVVVGHSQVEARCRSASTLPQAGGHTTLGRRARAALDDVEGGGDGEPGAT